MGPISAVSGLPANRLVKVHKQSGECDLAFVDTEATTVQCYFVFACYARADWAGWRMRESGELAAWFVFAQQLITGE